LAVIAVIGILVVIGAVLGGYMMHGGVLGVLYQPAELVIIGGAAVGAMLIGTTPSVLRDTLGQLLSIKRGGPSQKDFLDLLLMLYELLNLTRREGLLALENHVEQPEESEILKKYPSFSRNHRAVSFLCDTLRLILTDPDIQAHDLEALMDADLETHHDEALKPSRVLQITGDSLPGLGIVAAVLGIVITMGAINGPVEEIGHKVGAALVGTFLGVLLSYGFVQPLANNLATKADAEGRYFIAMKQVLLAFHKGCAPAVSVEFARRSIYTEVRPAFSQLDEAFRAAKSSVA
jgi:chemotaxis protein MotA